MVTKLVVPKAQAHGRVLERDARVNELLDLESNWWNMDLVQNVFNEDDAREIYGMAVCPQTRRDQIVWAGAKNGKFSMHSAYHMAKEQGLREEGSFSNP